MTQFAYVAPDRDPVDVELDALLILWHDFTDKYRFARSFKAPAMAAQYQSPKHYDWGHGIMDEVSEKATAKAVGECIHALEQPWQTAIVLQARNLATGADVWFSPRLPSDKAEREVILIEARNRLMLELRRQGVMS